MTPPPAIPPCPLCQTLLQPHLHQVPDHITNQNFDLLKCPNCTLALTANPPTDLSPYYQNYYGQRHGFSATFRAHRRLSLLQKHIDKKNNPTLLDVGCGEGTFLLAAKKIGYTVTGTELNPLPAQQQGLEVLQNLSALDPSRTFDAITLWHSLEHMPDPLATLRALHPLLKPTGRLFIALPNAQGWQAALTGKHWLHLDVPRHLFHFGPTSLQLLHQKSNFTILETHHQEFEYDLLGWSQSLLNKLLPTRNLFFRQLTGKAQNTPTWERAANTLAGPLLSTAALPLTWLSTLSHHGGTLLTISKKS